MFVKRGTIQGFSGSWGSGLGFLTISGEAVPCDNGRTVRALRDTFGKDVIGDNHTVNAEGGHAGAEIVYWLDDFGLTLGGFMPADSWNDRGLPDIPADGLGFDPHAWDREDD